MNRRKFILNTSVVTTALLLPIPLASAFSSIVEGNSLEELRKKVFNLDKIRSVGDGKIRAWKILTNEPNRIKRPIRIQLTEDVKLQLNDLILVSSGARRVTDKLLVPYKNREDKLYVSMEPVHIVELI